MHVVDLRVFSGEVATTVATHVNPLGSQRRMDSN